MAIIQTQGSLNTLSSRTTPRSLRPEVEDKLPVLDNQVLVGDKVIQNTFLNNTAVNSDNFKNELSLIAGYPEGSILKVTYYSKNSPLTDVRSDVVDILTPAKDQVHIDVTEIRDFEIRVSGDLQFQYTEDTNISSMTGEGIVYAGFVPHVGDFFLYELRNGRIGIFYVGASRRLALGQDTYHQISFSLQDFLTSQSRDKIKSGVTSVKYFDKVKFLTGDHALLNSQGYIEQKDLRQVRLELIQNYTDRFYSTDYSSFMRPDGVYDPYVVEYWNKKIGYTESPVRPVQLLVAVQNYKKTIWSALTNNPIKDPRNLAYGWKKAMMQSTFWGVNITSLLREDFIAVGNEKALNFYPNLDARNSIALYEPLPLIHTTRWDASIKAKADAMQKAWIRTAAYYNHLTPGAIPGDGSVTTFYTRSPYANSNLAYKTHKPFPVDETLCTKCEHREHCSTREELLGANPQHQPSPLPPKNPFKAPYPRVSKAELLLIWKRQQKLTDEYILSREQETEFQQYTTWYYSTYRGTYTKYELEYAWRQKHQIPIGTTLTEEQLCQVQKYIDWYVEQYPRALTDKELEVSWRVYSRVGLDTELTPNEIARLNKYCANYRNLHGFVRNDSIHDRSDEVPLDSIFSQGDIPAIFYQEPKCRPTMVQPENTKPLPPFDSVTPIPPLYRSGPPYPILSDQELVNVWCKIHHLPKDSPLSEQQTLQAKGYILWYRTTYPGTLSSTELKRKWMEEANITDENLTEEQLTALKLYTDSYRSNYLPVLTDREIEIIWRTKEGISLEVELDEHQLAQLEVEIKHYRYHHGRVPDDRLVDIPTPLGVQYKEDELARYATQPKQVEDDQTSEGLEGDIIDPGFSVYPDELPMEDIESEEQVTLPTIYYPPIQGFHLCPNFCHFLCRPPQKVETKYTKKPEPVEDTYVFSKEFYYGSNAMDPFERLVYDTLTNREIRPDKILESVVRYLDWDDESAFYRHLLSLYLIDRALYWLRYHS